ncbi:MAG: hypothetical protein JWR08_217 [Enterovirga sp.]|nr:hypothetical protein [Enterovirga sp.]
MLPLAGQVQRASDTAKRAAALLGGVPRLSLPDTERTFDDLQARIAATVAFIRSVPRQAIEGREDAEVTLRTGRGSFRFTGRSYALDFALPNFFFHVTTAYGILRHRGVPLEKPDYLGQVGDHPPADRNSDGDERHAAGQGRSLADLAAADAPGQRVPGEDLALRQEQLLDEALEETFPASDPISPKRITK